MLPKLELLEVVARDLVDAYRLAVCKEIESVIFAPRVYEICLEMANDGGVF